MRVTKVKVKVKIEVCHTSILFLRSKPSCPNAQWMPSKRARARERERERDKEGDRERENKVKWASHKSNEDAITKVRGNGTHQLARMNGGQHLANLLTYNYIGFYIRIGGPHLIPYLERRLNYLVYNFYRELRWNFVSPEIQSCLPSQRTRVRREVFTLNYRCKHYSLSQSHNLNDWVEWMEQKREETSMNNR